MSNITRIQHALPMPPETRQVLEAFERAVDLAISLAKSEGLPQGFLVAILHAKAQQQTTIMLEGVQMQ